MTRLNDLRTRAIDLADKLNERDAATVLDILARAGKYGDVTDRQAAFVESLLAKAAKPAAEKVDLSKITAMFDRAAEQLKRPFVNFLVDGVGEFRVSQAPATGRNPGSLYVKAGGTYLGKIAKDGSFSGSRDAGEEVLTALRFFAINPERAAHAYGQETGCCCFCARELTDARSVEVGYGPVCAERWGLPWGA